MSAIEKIDNEMHNIRTGEETETSLLKLARKLFHNSNEGATTATIHKYLKMGAEWQSHQPAPEKINEQGGESEEFQTNASKWLIKCFGEKISHDTIERNHRFLEEALELVQSLGCTKSEAIQLVDYVFNRPLGEPYQEVGGVMVTLAALCYANALSMNYCGEKELARVWTKIDKIREKQAAKPSHSPLPQQSTPSERIP